MGIEGTFFDFAGARPADAFGPEPRKGKWRRIPWKGRDGDRLLQGTMLIAGPETGAPPIAIDLGLRGPHALYAGLAPYGAMGASSMRIRMDGDPGFFVLRNDPFGREANAYHTRTFIQDCPVATVDLTGRRVHLAQAGDGDASAGVMLAYLRAVPVSGAALADGRRKAEKRLIGMNDGHGIFYTGIRGEEDLWESVLPYRDSGYSALHFCITGADHCNYPTRVGTLLGEGLDDFPDPGYRRYTRSILRLFERGVDPLASMMRMTRSVGLEFHVSIRMEAFALEPPYDGVFMSRFYKGHPELRCMDRDGRPIPRLSYAFPEVREHLYAIIDELSAYQPDGISFIFPRAQPFTLYEKPFLDEFRARHGGDPRDLPEDHPDVLALRAAIMDGFLREARQRTRPGHDAFRGPRPLELSALVLSDRRSNDLFGLDILKWARERWVDELAPTVWDHRRWRTVPEMSYLTQTCRSSGCRIVVNLHPAEISNEDFLPTARRYHEEGADGFSIWDGDPSQPVKWGLYRAIGRLDRLEAVGEPVETRPTLITLTELGDFVMDRYKSSWCF
jgi:hypothetical protein